MKERSLTGLVAGEVGGEVVDVDQDTGLVLSALRKYHTSEEKQAGSYAGVDSRNGDERAGGSVSAVLDVQLSTADVELSTAVGRGDVESDLRGDIW